MDRDTIAHRISALRKEVQLAPSGPAVDNRKSSQARAAVPALSSAAVRIPLRFCVQRHSLIILCGSVSLRPWYTWVIMAGNWKAVEVSREIGPHQSRCWRRAKRRHTSAFHISQTTYFKRSTAGDGSTGGASAAGLLPFRFKPHRWGAGRVAPPVPNRRRLCSISHP